MPSLTMSQLEKKLLTQFKKPELLLQACTHKSYTIEQGRGNHYEKLELLGDAILDFLVLEALMLTFPNDSEGQLSKKRASLVNQTVLHSVALDLDLAQFIRVSRGESRSGGLEKSSILSSVTEAILGAVYLDQGIEACRSMIQNWFRDKITDERYYQLDFKTELQELVQGKLRTTPFYRLMGDEKLKSKLDEFSVGVFVGEECWAEAKGKSKKEAEQKAAEMALLKIKEKQVE